MPFDANDPDTKKALADAIKEALEERDEAHAAELAKVNDKNKELIGENRKLKAGTTVDPADLAAVEKERDAATDKVADLEKQLRTATTNLEKATKELEGERGAANRLLIDNGLTDALVAAGVKDPAHQKAARAMLREENKIEIVAEGDKRVAKIGDKLLADHVKEWAGGDEGKNFVTAAGNSGGGSNGPGNEGGAKTMTRAAFDAADGPTRLKFSQDGGKLVDA